MNHVFVVDASVAVKWLLYEEFTDRAQALLRDSRQVLRPLLGPPLLASEVMNAIYKKVHIEQSITDEEAEQALTEFFLLARCPALRTARAVPAGFYFCPNQQRAESL